jgi:hypothetical protein
MECKLRALCLLSRCSISLVMPVTLFALVNLEKQSLCLNRPGLQSSHFRLPAIRVSPCPAFFHCDGISQTFHPGLTFKCWPLRAGMTVTSHFAKLLVKMGSSKRILLGLSLDCNPTDLSFSSS